MTHIAALRAARFEALISAIAGYECTECLGHDRTRPGGDPAGRYAILARANNGKLLELTRVSSRVRAQVVIGSHISEGWAVSALYDLDGLAGDEPLIDEGDIVRLNGFSYEVLRVDEELSDGEIARYLVLLSSSRPVVPGGEWTTRPSSNWDDWDSRTHQDEVELVKRCEPDERMPMRYEVAETRVIVVFNTVAS